MAGHRLAGRGFGIGAEARLRPILEGISDPARIEAVADAVLRRGADRAGEGGGR